MWKDDLSQSTVKPVLQRRTDTEKHQVGDYYNGPNRYYDQVNEQTVVKLYSGGCYTTANPGELIVTILGSCVACCANDPIAKIGGMNHFLLPGDKSSDSARFGVNAMELLLNGLMKFGAKKERLQIKIFGGSNLLNSASKIGDKNVEFIKSFLSTEGLNIVAMDVGGTTPRRVHFEPDTGKVMVRKLQRAEDLSIIETEKQYLSNLADKIKPQDDIILFDED